MQENYDEYASVVPGAIHRAAGSRFHCGPKGQTLFGYRVLRTETIKRKRLTAAKHWERQKSALTSYVDEHAWLLCRLHDGPAFEVPRPQRRRAICGQSSRGTE